MWEAQGTGVCVCTGKEESHIGLPDWVLTQTSPHITQVPHALLCSLCVVCAFACPPPSVLPSGVSAWLCLATSWT